MADLKTLMNSGIFDKNLHSDNRLKFALQIDPAINFVLKYLVIQHEGIGDINHNNGQLLDIVKQEKLIKEQQVIEIGQILEIDQRVKNHMLTKSQKEINNLLLNADKYLLQLKSIVEELIASEK